MFGTRYQSCSLCFLFLGCVSALEQSECVQTSISVTMESRQLGALVNPMKRLQSRTGQERCSKERGMPSTRDLGGPPLSIMESFASKVP